MIFSYLNDQPIVPLELQTKNNEWIEFHVYIDSGAGYSIFQANHAKILGIRLESGRKISFTVGTGAKLTAYVHRLPVKFAGKQFFAQIAFAKDLGIRMNLLGIASFFENFSICFHHAKKQVEVYPL